MEVSAGQANRVLDAPTNRLIEGIQHNHCAVKGVLSPNPRACVVLGARRPLAAQMDAGRWVGLAVGS